MIEVLNSSVIDKIAAGEVLERPAQLVKELVENALDAGATEVEVDVSSGVSQITVKDNGSGIPVNQMATALQRHATSKIKKVEDLFALHSFGFRGEALSSVASVSHFTMTSRSGDSNQGYRIESQFGHIKDPVEVSSGVGSEMHVTQLFDNVPARKKFLKSDSAELGQIKLVLKSFGLSRPDVDLKLTKDGALLFLWKKTEEHLDRVKDVLSLEDLYFAQGVENNIHVKAFYGAPNVTLRQNRGIWLFVQGRFVQDRALGAAIMESYRNLLMHGEYPHCVLFVDLPLDEVDVNVHPTKSQVRFSKPSEVFRAIVHVLRDGLQKTPWLKSRPEMNLEPSKSEEPVSFTQQYTFLDRELKRTQNPEKQFNLKQQEPLVRDELPSVDDLKVAAQVEVKEQKPSALDFSWAQLEVIGQLNQTYIVAQTEMDFYLVDQHAAHERVVFERLMRDWKNGRFTQQNYLIPLTVDFSEEEVEKLIEHKDDLQRMGLVIEQSGPESIAVMSAPEVIKESAVAKALKLFADQLQKFSGGFAVENAIADIFASMSCHSVIRAGQSLSKEEMKSLLEQMDEFPFSSFCPHGRPVYIKKSFYQIEREFGRIV